MADNWIQRVSQIKWSTEDKTTKDRWINDLRASVPNIRVFDETLTPAAVSADTFSAQAFTITGVKTSDTILGYKTAGGLIVASNYVGIHEMYVSADNQITIVYENEHTASSTPTSQLYTFVVLRTGT